MAAESASCELYNEIAGKLVKIHWSSFHVDMIRMLFHLESRNPPKSLDVVAHRRLLAEWDDPTDTHCLARRAFEGTTPENIEDRLDFLLCFEGMAGDFTAGVLRIATWDISVKTHLFSLVDVLQMRAQRVDSEVMRVVNTTLKRVLANPSDVTEGSLLMYLLGCMSQYEEILLTIQTFTSDLQILLFKYVKLLCRGFTGFLIATLKFLNQVVPSSFSRSPDVQRALGSLMIDITRDVLADPQLYGSSIPNDAVQRTMLYMHEVISIPRFRAVEKYFVWLSALLRNRPVTGPVGHLVPAIWAIENWDEDRRGIITKLFCELWNNYPELFVQGDLERFVCNLAPGRELANKLIFLQMTARTFPAQFAQVAAATLPIVDERSAQDPSQEAQDLFDLFVVAAADAQD
jgi:hypothetical protein